MRNNMNTIIHHKHVKAATRFVVLSHVMLTASLAFYKPFKNSGKQLAYSEFDMCGLDI